ncbi:MAG: ankyrin repeat domain-containing protein [Gallionellaceae bacterium]
MDMKEINMKLIEASLAGDLNIVHRLLAEGADANASDQDQDTSLICAANGSHFEIVKLLLASNVDVNAKNDKGYTALYVAAASNAKEALPIIELLLKSGANPTLGPTCGNDGAGATPLYVASFNGNNEAVKCLLKNGAPVNANLEDGSTMMHAAAAKGNQETVRLFFHIEVPLDLPRNDGNTPLHIACIVGNLDAATALLDLGASIESLNGKGETPLWEAVLNNRGKLVRLLLARGASHTPNSIKIAPLHVAAINGYDDILLMLIRAGASIVGKYDSCTAIELAITKKNKSTVDILNAELHKQKVAANLASKGRHVTVWVTSGELHI